MEISITTRELSCIFMPRFLYIYIYIYFLLTAITAVQETCKEGASSEVTSALPVHSFFLETKAKILQMSYFFLPFHIVIVNSSLKLEVRFYT